MQNKYNQYFLRQFQLFGEKQNVLKEKKILIIGAGGLGSTFAFALGSSGISEIDVVDFDTVSYHNIHRQIIFELKDIGKYKADIFKNRVESRYEGVIVNPFKQNFKEFISHYNGKKYDLILDACDNFETRIEIDKFAKSIDTNWIYSSVEDFYGKICFFDKKDFSKLTTNNHKVRGITGSIVMVIGSISANLALRHLIKLDVKKDTLFFVDISSGAPIIREINI